MFKLRTNYLTKTITHTTPNTHTDFKHQVIFIHLFHFCVFRIKWSENCVIWLLSKLYNVHLFVYLYTHLCMENRCCSERYFNGFSICADRYNHAVNTNNQTMDWTENDECLQNWTFVCFNAFFLHTNRMRTDHWHIASNNNYFGCCRVYEAAVTTISCVRQYVSLRRQYKNSVRNHCGTAQHRLCYARFNRPAVLMNETHRA